MSEARSYDKAGVEKAIRDLLVAVGEDPNRDGLKDTPSRMARAYKEMFAGLYTDPAEVLSAKFDIGHEEMVLEPLRVREGYLELPTKPGLGVELNDAAISRHPFVISEGGR